MVKIKFIISLSVIVVIFSFANFFYKTDNVELLAKSERTDSGGLKQTQSEPNGLQKWKSLSMDLRIS